MANRYIFGGGIEDYVIRSGPDGTLLLAPNAPVNFWNTSSGGTQYTNLADLTGTPIPGDTVTSDASGAIDRLRGPEGVTGWWADANGGNGPRRWMDAHDLGAQIDSNTVELATLQTQFEEITAARVNSVDGRSGFVTLDDLYVAQTAKGQPSGVASLNVEGKVPAEQLPEPPEEPDPEPGNVLSVNGQTGEVELTAADVGALDLGYMPPVQSVNGETGDVVLTADDVNALPDSYTPPACMTFAFSQDGPAEVMTGAHRIYNDTGKTVPIAGVRASVGTAPTGAALVVDINKNGTTMFTTQENRPTIPDGSHTSGKITGMDVTSLADGDYLTVDVDGIGSTNPGADLVVQVVTG